jgi:hypothetical protein
MTYAKRASAIVAAIMAVMAFAGVASASAASFRAESAPGTTTGGQKTSHVFTTDAGTVTCKNASFSGVINSTTEATTEVTPSYSECTAFGFVGATVAMNGCTYKFNSPTGSAGTYTGTTSIICPSGKEIVVTASGVCTVRLKGVGTEKTSHNSNKGTITYHNQGSGSGRTLLVETNVTGLEYSQSGFLCATETASNGKYTGSTEQVGHTSGGAADGIWIE